MATGLASVPLLGAKLWSVYPRLFAWPPVRDARPRAGARRACWCSSAAALFQLVTGVLNIAHWYAPMPFVFIASPLLGRPGSRSARCCARRGQAADHPGALPRRTSPSSRHRRSRRHSAGAGCWPRSRLTAGLVTLATVGQTVRPLQPVSVLAPRRPDIGPQGLPVNTTAVAAGVTGGDRTGYRLVVTGPAGTRS